MNKRLSLLLILMLCLALAAPAAAIQQPFPATHTTIKLDAQTVDALRAVMQKEMPKGEEDMFMAVVLKTLTGVLSKLQVDIAQRDNRIVMTVGSDLGSVATLNYQVDEQAEAIHLSTDLLPGILFEIKQSDTEEMRIYNQHLTALIEKLQSIDMDAWLKGYVDEVVAYYHAHMQTALHTETGRYVMPDQQVLTQRHTFHAVEGQVNGLLVLLYEKLNNDAIFLDLIPLAQALVGATERLNRSLGKEEAEQPDLLTQWVDAGKDVLALDTTSTTVLDTLIFYTDESQQHFFLPLDIEPEAYGWLAGHIAAEDYALSLVNIKVRSITDKEAAGATPATPQPHAQLGSALAREQPLSIEPGSSQPTPAWLKQHYDAIKTQEDEESELVIVSLHGKTLQEGASTFSLHAEVHQPPEKDNQLGLQMDIQSRAPLALSGHLFAAFPDILPHFGVQFATREATEPLPAAFTQDTVIIRLEEETDDTAMQSLLPRLYSELPQLQKRIQQAFPEEYELINALLQQAIEEGFTQPEE